MEALRGHDEQMCLVRIEEQLVHGHVVGDLLVLRVDVDLKQLRVGVTDTQC